MQDTGPMLLSPADAEVRAQSMFAWSDAQLREMEDSVMEACRAWAVAWGLHGCAWETETGRPRAVDAMRAAQVMAWQWMPAMVDDAGAGGRTGMFWILSGRDDGPAPDAAAQAQQAIQKALFGEAGLGSVMAQEIGLHAWTDWWRRLGGLIGQPALAPVPGAIGKASTCPEPWSGNVRIGITWWSAELILHLDAAHARRLLARHAQAPVDTGMSSKTGLLQAIASHTLAVRGELAAATLTLGQLSRLAPGDVVLLPHRLDALVALTAGDGQMLCHAWLGQQRGCIALALKSAATDIPHRHTEEGERND